MQPLAPSPATARSPAPQTPAQVSKAAEEFEAAGVVLTARRALASIEGEPPVLFVGVQVSSWEGAGSGAPMDALGRALGRVQAGWPVNLVLLDAVTDPVAAWMLERVRPFYQRTAVPPG